MDVRQPIPTNGGHWMTKFKGAWIQQAHQLQEKWGHFIEEIQMPLDHPTDVPIIVVKKEGILEILRYCKETPGFEYTFLADLTATDETHPPRFRVIYHLLSHLHHWRIRLKVKISETDSILSATQIWKGANWAEREVYDMFGISFQNHPDLRRILMDVRWRGYPLRKDYLLKDRQVFTEPEPINLSHLK